MTHKPSRSFNKTRKELLKCPDYAAMYLEECLASGDIALFKFALKNVTDVRLGGMTSLARKTELSRESLYKSLSKSGNPRLNTLTKVLSASGLRLSIVAKTDASV